MTIPRWSRIIIIVCLFVLLFVEYQAVGDNTHVNPPILTRNPPYIIAISSKPRPDRVIHRCVDRILEVTSVPIHIWGYLPSKYTSHPRIVYHTYPSSNYHEAFNLLPDTKLVQWVDDRKSHQGIYDNVKRTRWRTRVVLDAWAILTDVQSMFPGVPVLWIENDAILIKNFERRMEMPTKDTHMVSCHHKNKNYYSEYAGDGAVCIIFGSAFDFSVLLGYHLVEPLDWILLRSTRERIHAYAGAIHPRGHRSTLH